MDEHDDQQGGRLAALMSQTFAGPLDGDLGPPERCHGSANASRDHDHGRLVDTDHFTPVTEMRRSGIFLEQETDDDGTGIHCRILPLDGMARPERIVILESTEFRVKDDSRHWTSHETLKADSGGMTATSPLAASRSHGLTFANDDLSALTQRDTERASVFIRHPGGQAPQFRGFRLVDCFHDLVPVDPDELDEDQPESSV